MALIFIMMISTNTITSLKSASEAYSEKYQTSKMERFVKTVNGVKLLIIFAKRSILDVWQGCEYASLLVKSFDNVWQVNRSGHDFQNKDKDQHHNNSFPSS